MTDNINNVDSNQYDLNLIEQCILYDLTEKYPRTVSIKEMADRDIDYNLFETNMRKLMEKGLVEQRFQQFRLKKDP